MRHFAHTVDYREETIGIPSGMTVCGPDNWPCQFDYSVTDTRLQLRASIVKSQINLINIPKFADPSGRAV
jgi:hypothetical protein